MSKQAARGKEKEIKEILDCANAAIEKQMLEEV